MGEYDDLDCKALFGGAEVHEANEAYRQRRLALLQAGPEYVDVVHTGGYDAPKPVDLAGLELVDTGRTEDGEPVAVFEVKPSLSVCEPGEYEVEVDASLGAGVRVLGVLEGLVLLDTESGLAYMRARGAKGRRPVFKLSWQSTFAMPAKSGGKSPSISRARARARARRRR